MVSIAFVIVLLTDLGYVVIIRAQEGEHPNSSSVVFVATTVFVAIYLALLALLLGASLLSRPLLVRLRSAFRAAAAAGLLVIGVLALMSIGVLLVVAGALATGAALRSMSGLHWRGALRDLAAAIGAVAVLIAGFEVGNRLIVCPPKGFMSGSGYGLVTGGYHWMCVDGRLDYGAGFCSNGGGGVDANGHAFSTGGC